VDNPNDVTVTHDFDTVDAARMFVNAEGLKKAMQEAGVTGPPGCPRCGSRRVVLLFDSSTNFQCNARYSVTRRTPYRCHK
jgi:hypothetical protein